MGPRRATVLVILAAAGVASGCGEQQRDGGEPTARSTPRPSPKASPRGRTTPPVTSADAERLRPVLARWADALRKADFEAAGRFFDLPAVVSQGVPLELRTRRDAEAFNAALPCGARLEEVQQNGRYVVGTFELTDRPGGRCGDTGNLVRVAFVFSGERFSEWYQVPDGPGAAPGPPERPKRLAPAPRRPAEPADGTVQA